MGMSQQTANAKPHYFAALDGFRGVLAIMIALYHTMWLSNINSSDLFTNGPALVDMFFVFSGFLMFTLYDGKINSGVDGKAFIKRRFARIYPLHFFMLLVALGYAVARILAHYVGLATYDQGEILPFQPGATETMWSFLTNLTMTHSMGLNNGLSYNMPSWTVSVEFWAYFVFIGMMLWARPKKAWHFGVLSALIAVNYYVLSRIKPDMDFHYDLGFWRCLGGFFTGVVVAYAYRNLAPKFEKFKAAVNQRTLTVSATLVEIAALGTMAGFIIYFPGKMQFFIAPVAFIFVLGFAFDSGLISRLMGLRPFRYIAKISYSIYMVHILVSLFFSIFAEKIMPQLGGELWNATQTPGDLLLIPYMTCVLVFAHFTYKFVEMPGRKAIMAYRFRSKFRAIFSRFQNSKA